MLQVIPGIPALQPRGFGPIQINQISSAIGQGTAFDITEDSLHVATRIFNDASTPNVYRCYGLVGGVGTVSEVQDAADVAKRGRVVYAAGLIGTPTISLPDAEEIARQSLSFALYGRLNIEVPFNPFLEPGLWVSFNSARLHIASARAKIQRVRHQYSVGECRTYLDRVAVTT
jgi:hypothetical protein